MKLPISLIVLTYNEERHLAACLESAAEWVSEIVVVDSGSTDKTAAIAKQFSARIIVHLFENQARQFNWTLDEVSLTQPWILRLDADERMTPALWEEIAQIVPHVPAEVMGFFMKRRVYFMGRWIKHGGYYPTWILRLFRKGEARYVQEREVDEHLTLLRGRTMKFQCDFFEENKKDLTFFTDKHNRYASHEVRALSAEQEKERGRVSGGQPGRKAWLKTSAYGRMPLFLRAFAYFFYRYVLRGGFLDGKEGFIFHFLQGCWYRFLVDAKLYEYRKAQRAKSES